jgi:hypothetical protein
MMKNSTKIVLAIAAVALAVFTLVGVRMTGRAISRSANMDDFAKCLADSGAKMYGAYWCGHCSNQKKLFGDSWQYVNYTECDANGNNAKPELCTEAGVTGYPTWIFADGTKAEGELSFSELSKKSGCALP